MKGNRNQAQAKDDMVVKMMMCQCPRWLKVKSLPSILLLLKIKLKFWKLYSNIDMSISVIRWVVLI